MDEEEDETDENDEDEEEEEKEKEDDEETEDDVKEENYKDDEDLQEEEERKDIGEEINGKEGEEDKEESPRVSLEPNEREASTTLTTIITPIIKKGKRQRQTPLYFKTSKSTRIRQGKPQTPTKIPIVIQDSPKKQEKIPSPKSLITYVRIPMTRSTSSKGKEILQDTQHYLEEAETILHDTLLNLQETQKLENEGGQQQETKEKDPNLKEPSPQHNLDSCYRFFEGGRVLPQKFAIPLFFELEKQRAKIH